MEPFYEEKDFDGIMYFRTKPGGAFQIIESEKYKLPIPVKIGNRKKYHGQPIDDLLEIVRIKLNLKSHGAVADALGIHSSSLSYIRKRKYGISGDIILKVYDIAGISIEDTRKILKLEPFSEK